MQVLYKINMHRKVTSGQVRERFFLPNKRAALQFSDTDGGWRLGLFYFIGL